MSDGELIQKLRTDDSNENRLGSSFVLTILSIVAFTLISITVTNHVLISVMAITIALFLHEFGHFIAMYMFGFQNLKLLLIPFFGGVAFGKKHSVPSWQTAIILFAGPLPGLLLGLAIWMFLPRTLTVTTLADIPSSTMFLYDFATIFISFNALNLLPCLPLDGGRILQQMVDRKHFWLYVFFTLSSVLLGISVAVAVKMWPLAAIVCLVLFDLPHQARLLAQANRLKDSGLELRPKLTELTEEEARSLLDAARNLNRRPTATDKKSVAEYEDALLKTVKELHQSLSHQPLSLTEKGFLFLVYAIACTLPFITFFFPVSISVVTRYPAP